MWSFGVHVLLAVLRINNVEREVGVHEAEWRSNVRQAKCKSKGQWGGSLFSWFCTDLIPRKLKGVYFSCVVHSFCMVSKQLSFLIPLCKRIQSIHKSRSEGGKSRLVLISLATAIAWWLMRRMASARKVVMIWEGRWQGSQKYVMKLWWPAWWQL